MMCAPISSWARKSETWLLAPGASTLSEPDALHAASQRDQHHHQFDSNEQSYLAMAITEELSRFLHPGDHPDVGGHGILVLLFLPKREGRQGRISFYQARLSCSVSSFTVRNESSSEHEKCRRQSPSKIVAAILTVNLLTGVISRMQCLAVLAGSSSEATGTKRNDAPDNDQSPGSVRGSRCQGKPVGGAQPACARCSRVLPWMPVKAGREPGLQHCCGVVPNSKGVPVSVSWGPILLTACG